MRFLSGLILTLLIINNGYSFNHRLEISTISFELEAGVFCPATIIKGPLNTGQSSDILIWQENDNVTLRIVNFTSENHHIVFDNYADFGLILPGDSSEITMNLSNTGVYRYYDILNSPYNNYHGTSGLMHVKATGDLVNYFYWDLKEHKESWNNLIATGGAPVLANYYPDYFTINGNHAPNINSDPVARIVGNVNQEFKLVIMNNGLSIHSLHFHGYHLTVEKDSKNPSYTGRSKDTFGVYPNESLILSCTPDKPGEYPVHDHNLVAVTGGQQYATGMFSTILIAP